MHNGFYTEGDIIEDAGCGILPIYFLKGHCLTFAEELHKKFGYDIEYLFAPDEEGNYTDLIHAYCTTTDKDNKRLFIDVRGITDDYEEFLQDFDDWLYANIFEAGNTNYPLPGTSRPPTIPENNTPVYLITGTDVRAAADKLIDSMDYWSPKSIEMQTEEDLSR